MTFMEIWKRIGVQPMKYTRTKQAYVICGEKEYPIKRIVYENGVIVGFEIDNCFI